MKGKIYLILLQVFFVALVLFPEKGFSQTVKNDFQTRVEYKLSYDLKKKFKISIAPEMRFDEAFNPDKFLLESRLVYKPSKYFNLGGSYRFITNQDDENPVEYLHRLALDATLKTKIERWKPSFRLRFTDYTEEITDGEFLRYKASLQYNIKNCKLTPVIAAEAFHELSQNEFYKMRYSLGVNYKLFKNNSISAGYKIDYYMQEYTNKHILYVGYKMNF